MSNAKRRLAPVSPQAPAEAIELYKLLGPPLLVEGEDANAYDALSRQFRGAVQPKDVIEEIWVRDVVDLIWESRRLRRLRAALMRAATHEGLVKLLAPLKPNVSERNELVRAWFRGDPDARREVGELLAAADLSEAAIDAQTLAAKLDTFERIERLIAQADARRNVILREVERRRETVARRLRYASEMIEDAEFVEVRGPEK